MGRGHPRQPRLLRSQVFSTRVMYILFNFNLNKMGRSSEANLAGLQQKRLPPVPSDLSKGIALTWRSPFGLAPKQSPVAAYAVNGQGQD